MTVPEIFSRAFRCHQTGQFVAAEQLCQQILALDPDHADVWHLLGVIGYQTGNYELAVQQICRAIALNPGQSFYHNNLGNALQAQGKIDEAIESYRQAIRLDPDSSDGHNNLGAALQAQGKLDQAAENYRRAIALTPNDAEVHSNLATVLLKQAKSDKAISLYRRAIELDPSLYKVHYNLGNALRSQQQFQHAVASYQRALELNPELAAAHNGLGIALRSLGRLDEAVTCYHRSIALNPKDASAYDNLGTALQEQGKHKEAISWHQKALELRPSFAEAYSNLGNALQATGRHDEAIACHRRAVEIKPQNPVDYNSLGNSLHSAGHVAEAIESFRRAIELDPRYTVAHCNLGVVFQWQRQLDEAMACYERALAINPDDALAHFNRSFVRLLRGDWQAGWADYDWRWKTGRLINRKLSQPRWNGEPLGTRTLLLYGEQGFGDTFQFIRYAKLVKERHPNATVFFECHPPLTEILARYSEIDRLLTGGAELPPFDTHCPLLSLPGIFQTRLETIPAQVPYLFADEGLVTKWRERLTTLLGDRGREQGQAIHRTTDLHWIGINWHGRVGLRESMQRDVPVSMFERLAGMPAVRLISLQKNEPKTQSPLPKVEQPSPAILDLGEIDTEHGAFMDTAAIMMNLDLVITSDTSVAHLAGALGVPVWVALPYVPDWRWLLDRSDTPWYPTMRLFRQKTLGDWKSVFEEIQTALIGQIAGTHR